MSADTDQPDSIAVQESHAKSADNSEATGARDQVAPVRLVTVHGTGAGDTTATGDKWWQLGSDFLTKLAQRVDIDPQRVVVEPFQWEEGPNSEEGRREGAKNLLARLQEYESQAAEYVLIGHSHGGSVIYNSLLLAQRGGMELPGLKHWCTVGTPFLDYRANRFLFQRLSGTGLTVYVTALVALLLSASYWLAVFLGEFANGDKFTRSFSVALLVFGSVCTAALVIRERRRTSWFSAREKKRVEDHFGERWTGLWHPEDEAISALSNVQSVSGAIIPHSFLQPIVPAAQLVLLGGFGLVAALNTLAGGEMLTNFADFLIKVEGTEDENEVGHQVFMLFAMLAILFGVVRIAAWVLARLMSLIGRPLSALLNRVIWSSVRMRAWGDDLVKEDVHAIAAHPPEFSRMFESLPELVARPLRECSDGHAISTLNKVRRVLGMASDTPAAPDLRSELSESMKWKELIHTSYFDVPEFIDLLALSLIGSGALRAQGGFALDEAARDQLIRWLDGAAT